MNIKGIGANDHYSAASELNKQHKLYSGRNADTQKGEDSEVAATVSISNEAFKLYSSSKPFTIKIEKGSVKHEERESIPVQAILREGTAEHFIFNSLDGIVENAHELAVELGNMIFDRGENMETDIEVRALNRETGKKLAEYIASSFIDNPDEAQAFMEGINKHAERSEMRDKGYMVIIGSSIEPFKPKFDELKKFAEDEFGYDKNDWGDTEKSEDIYKAFIKETMILAHREAKDSSYFEVSLPSNSLLTYDFLQYMYKDEKAAFNAAFDENEKVVQEVINNAKAIVSGKDMNTMLASMKADNSDKWNSLMNLLQKG